MSRNALPNPPHPKDNLLLGSLPELGKDFQRTFVKGWQEVGDVCLFRAPRPMCLVAHPDHVRHVLIDHQDMYPRSPVVLRELHPVMGDGLFTSEGELWTSQRRLVEPLLTAAAVEDWGDEVTNATLQLVSRWRSGAGAGHVIDVQEEMLGLTLDIIARIVFGDHRPDRDTFHRAVTNVNNYAIPRVMALVSAPEWMHSPRFRRFRRALDTLDAMLLGAIRARRASATDNTDLISRMVRARDAEAGVVMSDQQVRDEIVTVIFGAFKGIAVALPWVFESLSQHPDVTERVCEEIDGVLDGRAATAADLSKLSYLGMTISEVLRLYPPLWIVSRPPTQDDEIGGYHIRKGLFVLMSPYITHRHPDFWNNPEAFDPERFTPERSAQRHPQAYFPFTAGPRKCVGDHLSMMVMSLVVATLMQHLRMDRLPGQPVELPMEFLLRRKNGVLMTLKGRSELTRAR